MTPEEQKLLVNELQIEMQKIEGIQYLGLEYPLKHIVIIEGIPIEDITQLILFDKVDKVFKARELISQLINEKIYKMEHPSMLH